MLDVVSAGDREALLLLVWALFSFLCFTEFPLEEDERTARNVTGIEERVQTIRYLSRALHARRNHSEGSAKSECPPHPRVRAVTSQSTLSRINLETHSPPLHLLLPEAKPSNLLLFLS